MFSRKKNAPILFILIMALCLSLTGCGILQAGENLKQRLTEMTEGNGGSAQNKTENSGTENDSAAGSATSSGSNSETQSNSEQSAEQEEEKPKRTMAYELDEYHQIEDTMTYVYEDGHLSHIDYSSYRTRWYDAEGRLIKDETPDSCKTYEYDERGNLVRSDTPSDGVVIYTYDDQDRLISKESQTDYGASTMMMEMMAVRVEYEYSADGLRCDTWTYNSYGTAIRHGIIMYNEYGDVVSEEQYRLNTDPIELATENHYEYDYDRNGNLIYKSTGGGTYTTYEYDANDQLVKTTEFFTRAGIGHEEQIYWSTLYEYNADGKVLSVYEQVTIDGVELDAVPTHINLYDAKGNLTGSFYYDDSPYDVVDLQYVSITRDLNEWDYGYLYVYDYMGNTDPYSLIPAEFK